MRIRIALGLLLASFIFGSSTLAQRVIKRHPRATPPVFQPSEFSGVFFPDAFAQLQGEMPSTKTENLPETRDESENRMANATGSNNENTLENSSNPIWKGIISSSTIEDLVKESKSRLDTLITSPAKFAGGGVVGARREFTLIASMMAVISQYPDEIRWKNSADYAQRIFAKVAMNCKTGSQPVFNEAKLRHQDLQSLLKGTKISGNAEEVAWADTADRGPSMQILEWALREQLLPATNSEAKFRESGDEITKYAELVAMFGKIILQKGMSDADDEQYQKFASTMTSSAQEVIQAVKSKDPELARNAVSRVEQACNQCHETYR
jgi:hypothetical protein